MDDFVSRKKRKLSPPPTSHIHPEKPQTTGKISALSPPDDDDSTDFKLALLSSLHPFIEQSLLLDVLLANDGSVEKASASLSNPDSPPRKSNAALGYQSSLSSFIPQNDTVENPAKRPKSLLKKGKTLHLYDPADVEEHTPCSIIHNFLLAEDANALLEELLKEAPTFEKQTFKLFDNVVQSPHTTCFYVESYDEMQSQKIEYVYNGANLTDVRQLTPQMFKVSPLVAAAVNTCITALNKNKTHPKQTLKHLPQPWKPNAALVNCYNGPSESVGYHSDQLTYLGPHAVIGSLSLGVAREFRVRKITPEPPTSQTSQAVEKADLQAQISIHLPHNSLLIMHPGMQEQYKHAISPAQTITPHPISGNKRINITYRYYKPSLHPKFIPKCKCGIGAVLRVVQRKKENRGRYFWMCYRGNVPGEEGCSFFEWAEWDGDGEPIWGKGKGKGKGKGERKCGDG